MIVKDSGSAIKSFVNEPTSEMVNTDYRKIIDCPQLYEYENKPNDMYVNDSDLNMTCNSEIEGKTEESLSISSVQQQKIVMDPDYQTLPKEFFKYDNIPPPLVNKVWLKSVYEENLGKTSTSDDEQITDESSAEDAVPLSRLKNDLILVNDTACDIRVSNNSKSSTPIIQRKRGRPRKEKSSEGDNPDNPPSIASDFFNENDKFGEDVSDTKDADWWAKSIDISSSSSALELKNELVSDVINLETLSNNEVSNYFEAAEEDNKNSTKKKATNGKKVKKKDDEIQGIKVDNSKVIFPCQECGKTFSAASTLKYHLRIHNGTLIKCRECDRGFTTNYLLKCHMRIHNGDLFMCHKCGRGFTTAELLKVHNRSHTGIRPYVCNICGKAFPSASNLTQHKETHEPEKKYLCFQCGSSFSQKRCLDGHMLSHGEKNHICTVCGKLWARKSDLTEHMRVHTGYKPYACSSCPQKFTQASSLRRHQIVHVDAKPVKCLTCGKMLKCDEYYKRHMKKHVKQKEQELASTA